MPKRRRNRRNEDEIIAPSHSQLLGPSVAEMGESKGLGLNHIVWRGLWASAIGCSSSLVMYASICNCIWDICGVPEMGSNKSSIARSAEFLKAQIIITRGTLKFGLWIWKIISRIMEIKGVMPLPPDTITRHSCLFII